MMRKSLPLLVAALLSACAMPKGTYQLKAVDVEGRELSKNLILTAQGSRIYPVRNALCQTYPKARVIILDTQTQQELASESPYQCR